MSDQVRVVRPRARERRDRRRRRRVTYLAGFTTVLFAVAAIALSYGGWRSALEITGGRDLEVTDPNAAGYTADVAPTDVELLALTADDGSLAAMLLLVDSGEAAPIIVPMSSILTMWDFEESGPAVSRDLFSDAGLDVLSLRLGVDLGFGITSASAIPLSAFAGVIADMGPIDIDLPDNVYVTAEDGTPEIKYPAGPMTLQPDEVGGFVSLLGRDELELNRSLRVKPVWTDIFNTVIRSGSKIEVSDEVAQQVPLITKFNGLDPAATERGVKVELLPTKGVPLYTSPPITLDRVDDSAMSTWTTTYVPFPVSAFPGQRAVVSLLNGTTNKSIAEKIAPQVVAAGGAVEQTGNAESFDIAQSRVEYGSEQAKAAAEKIGAQFGIAATKVDSLSSGLDVVVVIGKDLAR